MNPGIFRLSATIVAMAVAPSRAAGAEKMFSLWHHGGRGGVFLDTVGHCG